MSTDSSLASVPSSRYPQLQACTAPLRDSYSPVPRAPAVKGGSRSWFSGPPQHTINIRLTAGLPLELFLDECR